MKEKISLDESARNLQKVLDRVKLVAYKENRGVKKGTKRGKYKPRCNSKRNVVDRNLITSRCECCRMEFSYIRKGKTLRKYCTNRCRQKKYRLRKILNKRSQLEELLKNE
jgi:hypothetical protein